MKITRSLLDQIFTMLRDLDHALLSMRVGGTISFSILHAYIAMFNAFFFSYLSWNVMKQNVHAHSNRLFVHGMVFGVVISVHNAVILLTQGHHQPWFNGPTSIQQMELLRDFFAIIMATCHVLGFLFFLFLSKQSLPRKVYLLGLVFFDILGPS